MTLANALFVVAGVTLMVLLEWGRHRLDEWWGTAQRREKVGVVLLFVVIVAAGILILALALAGNGKN